MSLFTPGRKSIQLRSSSSDFVVPKVYTNFGTNYFSAAAPTLYNMLHSSVRSVENIVKFCHNLKAYLYHLA